MHCLHGDLLCECMWVIELEASGVIKEPRDLKHQ